jgi:predicted nucleic acid-binding protein
VSTFVLDASVALGWLVDKPKSTIATRIGQSLLTGDHAIVPSFWHLEVANGLAVAERRGTLTAQEVDRCIADIELLLVSALETRNDVTMVRQASEVARKFGLSSYDAIYVKLAQQEGISLATIDQKMRVAAVDAGVRLVH